jgi:hypothetical protein
LNASGELGRYRYLLVATHGYLSYTHPSLSAIVLRQPGAAGFDGYLTAAELPLYELTSELIVLSACETGLGPVRAGAGVMGLPLALMVAGNRNAVVTLWSVPDASAAEFVTRLFRHLKAGAPPDEALTATKREMARHPRFGHPVHWAGFVLYGRAGRDLRTGVLGSPPLETLAASVDYFLSASFAPSRNFIFRSGMLSISFFFARYSAAAFSKSFLTGFLPWS